MTARVVHVDHDAIMVTHSCDMLSATDRVLAISGALRGEPKPTRSVTVGLGVAVLDNRVRSAKPRRFRWTAGLRAVAGELTPIDPGMMHLPRSRPEPGADADPDGGADHPALTGVGRRD